jgi:hypothetical protein
MYHDEFARKPVRPMQRPEVPLSSLPFEVGGGLSLGLAVSLNQPISMALFYLGGLLPLVACSIEIAARRASEFLLRLAPSLETCRPSAVPVPHLPGISSPVAGSRFRHERARSAR